ncbi:efflux RND transporter periplasmic adaptor subunit [Curvibacter sp. HBC61]|uniref:Efflux RND transporter periplasmic adaptor subunit n=1 Tax=Curvibacter cyanobacteriorum TaxID=3026422 RepID=A0ABT5N099_9BURK|nr:efflux RND transporter periplasmic adaptor subunit [Curvibacter sp. HBC61]MDD0839555.1 efflux RND transporter periplasmic adaptor subunit [Curvibacter sp. HBC61]
MRSLIPRSRSALALGCALAVSMLLTACNEPKAPAPAPPPGPTVQGQQLRFPAGHPQLALLATHPAQPAQEIPIDLPSRLVWNEERTQRLYPALAGRVTAIQADVGQAVDVGSPLARMASPELGQAQADTARALIDARQALQTLQRQRELFNAGIIARKDLEQSEADAARAQAEATRAQARTALYGGGHQVNQQLTLSSGIKGVVVERNINPGQEVRPDAAGAGAPPLFVISDPRSLWVQIDAREVDIGLLSPGAKFELEVPAYPGVVFTGQVLAASDAIDPGTRTIKVRGLVNNTDRRLKAEMLATARIRQSFKNSVRVPATAITLRGNRHAVFVQTQPGVFEPREITLSFQGPKEVVISQGLQPGEQVVTDNALLLARQFHVAQEEALGRAGDPAGNTSRPSAPQKADTP